MTDTTILGYSGLHGSVAFKRREFPGLTPADWRIVQGLDSSAALVRGGNVVAAAAEERFNGEKHSDAFPAEAIRFCLKQAGKTPDSLDWIAHAFSYGPFRSAYEESSEAYLQRQFQEVYDPQRQVQYWEAHFPGLDWQSKFFPVSHHLAHAASAFYPSGFDEALILVSDGMGEYNATSIAVGRGNVIETVAEIPVPHSLGIFYGVMTRFLGFDMAMDESKVMGLAPYGNFERYIDVIREWIQLDSDGSYSIPFLYTSRTREEKETYAESLSRMEACFGSPRAKGNPITQRDKDLAAALQKTLERTLLHILRFYQKETGLKKLCFAGGVALNCAANGVILRSGLFEDMFVQPGAGDDGAALGAALYVQHKKSPPSQKSLRMRMPDWGPDYEDEAILAAAAKHGLEPVPLNDRKALLGEVVRRLKAGEVIAWFQGRMEFGPRALGRRSILADPRDATMRDRINALVKKREAFRPFAPAVTSEAAIEFFEIDPGDEETFAHMLFVTHVKENWRDRLPAITHVDGTARVQTVDKEASPAFWELLRAFGEATEVEMLLNTSFNIRGQPIVRTPEEALSTFKTANLDALVAEHFLFVREEPTVDDTEKLQYMHDCVARHASQRGHAIAISCDGQKVTYGELNSQAEQLAAHLRQLGIGRGDCVALCMERSLQTLVGLVAILKTGAAFSILDMENPANRLDYMIRQAGINLIISDESNESRSREWGPPVVCPAKCDDPSSSIAQSDSEVRIKPDDLAYVLYTSGSTGQPKGVEIRHESLLSLVRNMATQTGMSEQTTFFCVAPLHFDMSMLDVFAAFTLGARLELISRKELVDTKLLTQKIDGAAEPFMHATPSLWRMVLDGDWTGHSKLCALSGGEPIGKDLASQLQTKSASLWNAYGPTETTVVSVLARIDGDAITIGKPLSGEYVRILNDELQAVPNGEVGELCIGGNGLAVGYRKLPELTAERFIEDPLAPGSGRRIYRTGDLVRQLPDGNLEYLGRKDRQLKHLGNRIEPAEIEEALRKHPGIKQVTVDLRSIGKEQQLVAYFVTGTPAIPGAAELTGMLKQHLPDYMIPAQFVALPELPLTANHKIDYRALPDPQEAAQEDRSSFVAPESEIEKELAAIWAEVFDRDRINMNDNFIRLGGHSILAMRLVSKIRQRWDIPLSPDVPFRASSVAEMATLVTELKKQKDPP